MGLCFTKMGVCFSKMEICFFVCDLQCELLNSGRRLSRPISVAQLRLHCSYSALQLKEGLAFFV